MKQVTKFYLSSFLKNQSYFTPIFVLFLQFYHLTYSEIFWVFTIGGIASFILEIPSGVIADLWGRKESIVLSKLLLVISFVLFGFATNFWFFVIAQIMYEIGESFRSGTEAAYIYDAIEEHIEYNVSYTEVKGKQKFYARVGEAIATAIGGVLAVKFGYNAVFFFAAIPAFANFLQVLTWPKVQPEDTHKKLTTIYSHVFNSINDIWKTQGLLRIVLNITFFYAVLQAVDKFVQPFMLGVGVSVAYIGFFYAGFLGLGALIVRNAHKFENTFGAKKLINSSVLIAALALLILGFTMKNQTGIIGYFGIGLFFVLTILDNIRSPVANSTFHGFVDAKKRATMGSMLALSKSLGKLLLLPIIGYFTDMFSLYVSLTLLGFFLLFIFGVFYVRNVIVKK